MSSKGADVPISWARPEIELLLFSARTHVDEERAERIRTLAQADIDWEYLIRIARKHALMPLLYRHVNGVCPELVPASHLRALRDMFNRNLARNLCLSNELCKVVTVLEAQGIPTIPYKGPALAVSVYGDLSLRQFGDLDIVVHKGDVFRAAEILEAQGYRPELQLNSAQKAAYLRSKNDFAFVSPDGDFLIEIHWNFIPAFLSATLDPERFWKRLRSLSLTGIQISTFAPEDLLLILCIHSTKHMWERLNWITDIAELIESCEDLDWELVLREAVASGTRRMLLLGLYLANRTLGAQLPAKIMQMAENDRSVRALAAQAEAKWFQEDVGKPHVLSLGRFYFRSLEGYGDRSKYCLRLLLTPVPGDWRFVQLPERLYTFYYLIRPYRLFVKYILRPLTRRS